MFLHAHRLVLPNKVEPLDLNAGDPFYLPQSDLSPRCNSSSNNVEPVDDLNAGDSLLKFQPDPSLRCDSSTNLYEEKEVLHTLDERVYLLFQDQTLPWKIVAK